jgi:8-amino-7-oxononanoate synthase
MSWKTLLESRIRDWRELGQYRELAAEENNAAVRSFSHNDYLGLSNHPQIIEAASKQLSHVPSGARGSRLLGGNEPCFAAVEAKIADFFHAPAALFFSSGYLANQAIVTALGGIADEILSDEKCHASLIDGVRLCKTPRKVVPHQGWAEQLELATKAGFSERPLLVAESLYSMDGDAVDEEALRAFWQKSGGFLILDEAHAAGVFDDSGLGISTAWRDFSKMAVTVTFGKAFGVAGAAILCSSAVKEVLVNSARSFIYTTAPSPWVAALVSAALDVMHKEGEGRRRELRARAREMRGFFDENGLEIPRFTSTWDAESPIIPVVLGGNDRALRFAQVMRRFGWSLKAIRYPTVSKGAERIRISLNLDASQSETREFAKEVVRQWKAFS